ncbi:MAG: NERD domain-containing protein [Chloroflexi bacterium]|nr:NERD domain-containing protein [Chloroflexota bacterium]
MRVETNWKLVRRNRRLANFLFFFSMAVLIAGFVVANSQLMNPSADMDNVSLIAAFILPWIVLPVGFISTLVSVRMTNLWVRKPRPEEVIREGLKGVNKRSVLYNYYHFPARHVLITPSGVFAMITRYQDGYFMVDGDRWQTPGGALRWLMRLFRRDDIGNPTEESLRAAAHVKTLLGETAADIQVQPLIIFVSPRARVEIIESTVPVLYADSKRDPNLRDYMRDYARRQAPQENIDAKARKKAKPGKAVDTSCDNGRISPEELAEALDRIILRSGR